MGKKRNCEKKITKFWKLFDNCIRLSTATEGQRWIKYGICKKNVEETYKRINKICPFKGEKLPPRRKGKPKNDCKKKINAYLKKFNKCMKFADATDGRRWIRYGVCKRNVERTYRRVNMVCPFKGKDLPPKK